MGIRELRNKKNFLGDNIFFNFTEIVVFKELRRNKFKTMEQAKPNNEKTELVMERKLEDLPVEVLVKIFNYLPNHDVRCGVALACKEFRKICQDESLVPVKDLSIKGHYYKQGRRNDFYLGGV